MAKADIVRYANGTRVLVIHEQVRGNAENIVYLGNSDDKSYIVFKSNLGAILELASLEDTKAFSYEERVDLR